MNVFKRYVFVCAFYCLYYDTVISTYIPEDRVAEERDPDLNEEEDIRLDEIREEHCRDVSEEDDEKNKIHAMRW